MANIKRVGSARKTYVCSKCGKEIKPGDSYLRGSIWMKKTPVIRCTSCGLKGYELSTSSYVQSVGAIVEDWMDNYGICDGVWDALADELEAIRDTCEESLENMPEGLQEGDVGQLLQDRMDALDDAADTLRDMDFSTVLEESVNDMSEEERNIIGKEVAVRETKNLPSEYVEFYDDFCEGRFAATFDEDEKDIIDSLIENWKESVDDKIAEGIDDAISGLEY